MLVGSMCAMQPYKGKGVAKYSPRCDAVGLTHAEGSMLCKVPMQPHGPRPISWSGVWHIKVLLCVFNARC
jgi:hypothetical protein